MTEDAYKILEKHIEDLKLKQKTLGEDKELDNLILVLTIAVTQSKGFEGILNIKSDNIKTNKEMEDYIEGMFE